MTIEAYLRVQLDNLRALGYNPKALLLGYNEYTTLFADFVTEEERDNGISEFMGLKIYIVPGIGVDFLFDYKDSIRYYKEVINAWR